MISQSRGFLKRENHTSIQAYKQFLWKFKNSDIQPTIILIQKKDHTSLVVFAYVYNYTMSVSWYI